MKSASTMSATIFPKSTKPVLFLSLLIVYVICSCCFLSTLTLGVLAQTQTTTTNNPISITNSSEQYPVTLPTRAYSTKPTPAGTASVSQAVTATTAITTPLTTTSITATSVYTNNNNISNQQPKSLKFTLIAGKFWKFNIKPNSFSTKEGELRLHKNVITSANNYIIDDEGWFQYNPQQQQLFAWPNLFVKPGTYLFALLPSGIDFEADSENDLANPEVAANIVVELIRPLYIGSKNDIDQLVDHKFSLDFLHRHQTYPLLLQQIVAVFYTIAQSNDSTTQPDSSSGLKAAKRLGEYLLINSSYTYDGEYFSLTWSTHPALVNNTISQLYDCRVGAITDIVTKLSTLSARYQRKGGEYFVYYPIDAPTLNSQAIVPTERGGRALKVTLNGPCQVEKIVQQLGPVTESTTEDSNSIADGDDKENNNVDLSAAQTSKDLVITLTSTSSPGLPAPEAIDSTTASKVTTSRSINTSFVTSLEAPVVPEVVATTTKQSHLLLEANEKTAISGTESPLTPTTTQASRIDIEAQVFKSQVIPVQQQPKIQPQAKSFAGFLESSDAQQANTTMTSTVPTPTTTHNNPTVTAMSSSTNLLVTIAPNVDVNITSESSLNEDLIGILDDIVNYLTSVAIPVAIIIGLILLISIFIALCSLYMKRKKSKQFQVRNRFDFRYGSERKGFLKNSSKPVILDADHKSLSNKSPTNYFPLNTMPGESIVIGDACGVEDAAPACGDSGGLGDS